MTVFNDYRGMYQIFQNIDQTVISSAFLSVYESLSTRTPSTQEIDEYLTFTAHFDDQTMLKEIRMLGHHSVHGVRGELSTQRKRISLRELDEESPFDEHAWYVQGDPKSVDVQIARSIANGEDFDIQYSEDEAEPSFDVDEYQNRVWLAYHYLDGAPHPGIFSDMAMISDERRNTERKERLRLYGMGDEIIRTTRSVSDRSLSVKEFMTFE